MKILITAFCQTAGIAATLKELLPEYQIEAHQLPALLSITCEVEFVDKLKSFDIWITSGHFHFPDKYNLTSLNNNFKIIKIPPAISFPAFHPDLCYAEIISTGEWTTPNYNSAIALWCYINGISVEDAATAFCQQVYKELGYFEIWQPSVAYLRQLFIEFGMEEHFNGFFLKIKRQGCFFHTINHPKIDVLIQMAKIIAIKIGAEPSKIEKDVSVIDTLSSLVWPVYPELADYYSIKSNGYVWKWSGGVDAVIQGNLIEFLEFAYNSYINQGVNPTDLRMIPGLGGRIGVDGSIYDKVLNLKFGVNK